MQPGSATEPQKALRRDFPLRTISKCAILDRVIPRAPEQIEDFPFVPHGPCLGLVADDLTGACDTGVQFAQRGFSSVVRLDVRARGFQSADLEILVTNSRNDSPSVACSKVQKACQLLNREHRRLIYKKIDSTLHGNLGPEIQMAMKTAGFPFAIVAPAFPAMGRTIGEGWLRVTGRECVAPIHIPSLLRKQGAGAVAHLNSTLLRRGRKALVDQLARLAATRGTIVVLDAASQRELLVIAQAAMQIQPSLLMVGSAALAAEVAKILAKQYHRLPPPAPAEGPMKRHAGSVVLIVGSTNPRTAAQINCLRAKRPVVVTECEHNSLATVRRALEENQHIVVNFNLVASGRPLANFLTILEDSAVRGVILSGGDTANQVCRILKAAGIRLRQEILPGIPWGQLVGGLADGLPIATKAGGFGREESLVLATDFLATRAGVCT